jgi:hypothetical protein
MLERKLASSDHPERPSDNIFHSSLGPVALPGKRQLIPTIAIGMVELSKAPLSLFARSGLIGGAVWTGPSPLSTPM